MIRRARGSSARKAAVASALFNNQARPEDGRSFLLGDENGGLFLFDTATEEVRPGILPSMRRTSDNWKATTMFEDNQGNVWLGLYQNGLLVAPKSMFGFSYLGFDKNGVPGQNSACVMSLYDDGKRLWVGTDGAGLFCTEPGGRQTNFNKDNSGLTNNAVMCVEGDKHGNLWIGTYLDGLFYMDAARKIHLFPEQERIGTMRIRTLEYDEKRDLLYVGTYGAGLVVIDPARLRIVSSTVDEQYLWISALHLDKSGLLWVGTYNGPYRYEVETGQIALFQPDNGRPRIYSIASDDDGNIWFGTGDGVFCTDAEGTLLKQYNESDGAACPGSIRGRAPSRPSMPPTASRATNSAPAPSPNPLPACCISAVREGLRPFLPALSTAAGTRSRKSSFRACANWRRRLNTTPTWAAPTSSTNTSRRPPASWSRRAPTCFP